MQYYIPEGGRTPMDPGESAASGVVCNVWKTWPVKIEL
jgi:hypothetical protein